MSTIVTLALDSHSHEHFNTLRRRYYPAHLNQIEAHLTLFHTLPATDEIRKILDCAASASTTFEVRVAGVMSLASGTAYRIESPELERLHAGLSSAFASHLSAQDRQPFKPHIVVQNKVTAIEAKQLQSQLSSDFCDRSISAEGIEWWDYLGGPWELRERFRFNGTAVL